MRLARSSWWLYLPSLPLFLAGLSQGWLVPLGLGGTLLFGAISLYVGIVLATLFRAPYRDVVFWHLLTSVIGLAVAASLGLLLALSKHVGFLGEFTLPILAAHATLMLGAWVAPLLMGVAYRLVASDRQEPRQRRGLCILLFEAKRLAEDPVAKAPERYDCSKPADRATSTVAECPMDSRPRRACGETF